MYRYLLDEVAVRGFKPESSARASALLLSNTVNRLQVRGVRRLGRSSLVKSNRRKWTIWEPNTGQTEQPMDLILDLTPGPQGPLGNGHHRRINGLRRVELLPTARNALEVLAGAISWGFKSPSPHHIKSRCIHLIQWLLSFWGKCLSVFIQFGFPFVCDVICAKLTPCSLVH